MFKTIHRNIHVDSPAGYYKKLIKITVIIMATIIGSIPSFTSNVKANSCSDLKVIFARGSGSERYKNDHYQSFKKSIENKLATSNLTYEIDDLDYSAVGVGPENLLVALGALFSGGEAYAFGDSVKEGADEIVKIVNSSCKNTKFVLGGYSQGAIVILNSLERINPDRIIYAATFGDPKIYLPEGAGPVPVACGNKNLSKYRIYVPDCRAYKGLLGARNPYTVNGFENRIGTWCNKFDIMCSSHYSIENHTSYVEDGLYEDASRLIFSKIATEFNFKNQYTSPHDTAILIDSTGSMSGLIEQYKEEALRLAEKTLSNNGRVALYDYRDLDDGYDPVERCNFETCTLEIFKRELNGIEIDGGGDEPESLLSASFKVMKELNWKLGSTKSLVILTNAGYHSPDLDGITFYDVQKLSKQIDPVNFYIITNEENIGTYQPLANATGGNVATNLDELDTLVNNIMEKYDSLPRVEEEFEDELYNNNVPSLNILSTDQLTKTSTEIQFETDGTKTVVVLNDAIVGLTEQKSIILNDLDFNKENKVMLIPLSSSRRGEGTSITLDTTEQIIIPKAPNTGKQ